MPEHHRFVLKIEDGYTTWALICPSDGSCHAATACSQCGRGFTDTEIEPCYDCPTAPPEGCWAQSWVGEQMAEETIHGTVEVEFPVVVQWTGDGLEAHVNGPPIAYQPAEVPS
jgi:hypothetical protein